ncbi:Homeodomain-like [Lasallia pustulata]|uniref:Homeodomain-like n=1 Tax=Lasallia pustulata TaxID=136370 RepID=A0A1W5D5U2_9LECA|nr:Homeodomain-like [Lasallia pustulata]
MADRTSVRSSNRRNTPQSPPLSIASASPQRRVTRSARSPSHDVSDSEPGRTATKRGRRGARQASVESVQSTEGRGSQAAKRTKRATRDRTRAANDLSLIAEGAELVYPDIEEADNGGEGMDEDAAVQNQLRRETKSPGAVSAISGTTARTSHSAQELDDLDPEGMLDALPDLLGAANKILNFLAPQNTHPSYIINDKDLQDSGSRATKNLRRLEATFRLQRGLYGSEQYINHPIALRALLKERHFNEVGSGPWRPDGVLQTANLTTLAMTILPARKRDPSAQHALEKLGRDFPTPFLHGIEVAPTGSNASMGNSTMLEDTFAMALEVRTQFSIMLLSRHMDRPNFDPDTVLKQVFFESENAVKGWDTPGLRAEELSMQQVKVIKEHVRVIRDTFPEDSQALESGQFVNLDRLNVMFPWHMFRAKIASWCRMRQDEIERQLEYQGGLESIVQALGDEIKRRETFLTFDTQGEGDGDGRSDLVQLHYEPPPEPSEATSDHNELSNRAPLGGAKRKKLRVSFNSPSAIAHLKQRVELDSKPAMQQEVPKLAAKPLLASTQPHTPGNRRTTSRFASTAPAKITNDMQLREQMDDEWRQQDFDDVGDEPLLNQHHYAEQRLQLANRQLFDLENNKENIETRPSATIPVNKKHMFIDRQTDAERISFDDSQQSGQQAPAAKLRRNRTRHLEEDEEYVNEEGEDEGEISDPSEDEGFEKDDRVHDVQRKRNAAPVRKPRALAKTVRRPGKRTRVEEDEEEIRAAVDQHNRANAPRPSQAQIYQRAKDQAKHFSATQPKPVQRRNAWSEEETEALLEYIETIGTSYAQILSTDRKGGEVLQSRDQVGLKDKARNMKMDFLKANVDMPTNFERIPLSKLQVERLRGLGISYNEATGRRGYAVEDEDESDEG